MLSLRENLEGSISNPIDGAKNSNTNQEIEIIEVYIQKPTSSKLAITKKIKVLKSINYYPKVKLEDLREIDLFLDEVDSNGVRKLKRVEIYPELEEDIFVPINYVRNDGVKISDNCWINKKGEIWLRNTNRIIEVGHYKPNSHGYVRLPLENKNVFLHQLVGYTFLINPDKSIYTVVNHLDHNKENNNLNNLCFLTYAENSNRKNGTSNPVSNDKLIKFIAIDDDGNEVGDYLNKRNTEKSKLLIISRSIKENKKVYGYKWKKILPEGRLTKQDILKILQFTKEEDYNWEPHSIYPNLWVCKEGFIKIIEEY